MITGASDMQGQKCCESQFDWSRCRNKFMKLGVEEEEDITELVEVVDLAACVV